MVYYHLRESETQRSGWIWKINTPCYRLLLEKKMMTVYIIKYNTIILVQMLYTVQSQKASTMTIVACYDDKSSSGIEVISARVLSL